MAAADLHDSSYMIQQPVSVRGVLKMPDQMLELIVCEQIQNDFRRSLNVTMNGASLTDSGTEFQMLQVDE